MKKLLLFLCLFVFKYDINAQTSANWFFGVNAGLHFPGPSVISGGALNTTEGCSSISSSSGSLLFYTDGVSVWDHNNNLMPNGTGLTGDVSSTQSALIVPAPGNANLYYIFTVDADGGPYGFRYSLVDMTANGGLGDVTTLNTLILSNTTEKLSAVKKFNGTDYWIITHEWGTDAFYAYTLDATGLQTTPVITNIGTVHSNSQIQNTYGQLKFNTCGTQIALAIGYQNTIELFDFDPGSGILSSPVTIPMTDHVYGIEFSPDNNFLYASCYDPSATLVQFDISSHNASTIIASMVPLSTTPDIYGIQLANNGNIYVCRSWSSYLGEIDDPNIQGTGCNYNDNGIFLDPNSIGVTSGLGMPGFIQSSFQSPEMTCTITGISENIFSNTLIYPNPASQEFTINGFPGETIFIYDNLGKEVEQIIISSREKISFGKNYVEGIYHLKIVSNDSSGSKMIIKL